MTVCVKDHVCLLGDVFEDQMRENECGRIVTEIWASLPQRFVGLGLTRSW